MSTTTQTTLDEDRRWRECLAATFFAWRYLDAAVFGVLDANDTLPPGGRELARCRQRMADQLDLLEREWVLRQGGLR